MSFIEWSNEELVNIKKVDAQHSGMINIVNEMHQHLSIPDQNKHIELFEGLVELLVEHCNTEEYYMKEYDYPGYISHKLEHDRFVKKITNFSNSVKTNEDKMNLEMLKSLKKWFFNHLELNDRKLGEYLNEKGID